MSSSSPESIRILLINRDAIARAGVKLLLESKLGLKVIAEAGEKKTALEMAEQKKPDIVLLHDSGEDGEGFDLFSGILDLKINTRILLVTSHDDSQYHLQAVKKGAVGVVVAHNSPEFLFKAIEKVHAGEVWLDRSLIADFFAQETRAGLPGYKDPQTVRINQLSDREKEIIELVGEGLKNQQIADQLYVSEVTVRHHLTSIYKKLNVTDRLELVIYAYQNNLAKLPE